jgi:RHH-type proline utilization regulon transcriptional repressor/proline dehydrogenase/delta 1-pyrroline-5-carboxylate dehydrogenase
MLEHPVIAELQPVINPAEPKDIVGYVREARRKRLNWR